MALIDNLISYWKLDESSGDATDAHGSNTLTDSGTVGTGTGKINTARDFESTIPHEFTHVDNADLSAGDTDWSFACWVNLEDKSATRTIASKHNGATIAGSEWLLSYDPTADRFRLSVYQGAGNSTTLDANNFGSPSIATWYHIVVWHDSVNNEIGISVNAGTADTAAWSVGINDTATGFCIGGTDGGGAGTNFDGLIDEAGWWRKVLSGAERTQLYGAGSGLAYPFVSLSVSVAVPDYRYFPKHNLRRTGA